MIPPLWNRSSPNCGRIPARISAVLIAALAFGACAPRYVVTRATSSPPPSPTSLTSLGGPTTGCYYGWATRELPELSAMFQDELDSLDSTIIGSAYAFGEDCRQDDGTVTFLPMETDFRVRVAVLDFGNAAYLGSLIRRTMEVIDGLPVGSVPGTRPGRAEFEFIAPASEPIHLTIDRSRFRAEASNLADSEILQHFQSLP